MYFIRQRCLVYQTLTNIYLDRIISDALEYHNGSVSIGGRIFINFVYAIVVNAEEGEEANDIVTSMVSTCARNKIEIGPGKTTVMTNNFDGFQREIKIIGEKQEEVKRFIYLGSVISKERSKPEIFSRIA